MTPSSYQQAIFDVVTSGSGHRVIEAVAGSGKTTTIVKALELTGSASCLFLAFNKHIAEELKRRTPINVEVATLNSFGWRVLRRAFPWAQLEERKTALFIEQLLPDRERRAAWGGALVRAVGLLKHTLGLPAREVLDGLAERFDLEIPDDSDFLAVLQQVWERGVRDLDRCDFDDQVFVPVDRQLPVPRYGFVFVDEAQDLSPVQIELVVRLAEAGARIFAVGDSRQAIYGFRGADTQAMARLEQALYEHDEATERLPLSICYRCPTACVELARQIVPQIEAAPDAPAGQVRRIRQEALLSETRDGDYVLCRTTAPLVGTCLRFIAHGRKAMVKGRDIGKSIQALIDKVAVTSEQPIVEFLDRLDTYVSAEVHKLLLRGREAQAQALQDKAETIDVLSEGALTVQDISAKLERIFSDADSPGVTFATIHRAKGLEARRIFCLRPDLVPFPAARKPWQVEQEMNLKYVLVTRVKGDGELVWVDA